MVKRLLLLALIALAPAASAQIIVVLGSHAAPTTGVAGVSAEWNHLAIADRVNHARTIFRHGSDGILVIGRNTVDAARIARGVRDEIGTLDVWSWGGLRFAAADTQDKAHILLAVFNYLAANPGHPLNGYTENRTTVVTNAYHMPRVARVFNQICQAIPLFYSSSRGPWTRSAALASQIRAREERLRGTPLRPISDPLFGLSLRHEFQEI